MQQVNVQPEDASQGKQQPTFRSIYTHLSALICSRFRRAVRVFQRCCMCTSVPSASHLAGTSESRTDVGRGAESHTDARAEAAGAVDAVLCCQRGAARAAGACLGVPPGARGSLQAHGHCDAQPLLIRPRAAHIPPIQGLRCEQLSLSGNTTLLLQLNVTVLCFSIHMGGG